MTAPHSISSGCATALGLLQDSSCFRGEVCSTLPCACAETLAAALRTPALPSGEVEFTLQTPMTDFSRLRAEDALQRQANIKSVIDALARDLVATAESEYAPTTPFSRWADIIEAASLTISPKGSEALNALAEEIRNYDKS